MESHSQSNSYDIRRPDINLLTDSTLDIFNLGDVSIVIKHKVHNVGVCKIKIDEVGMYVI